MRASASPSMLTYSISRPFPVRWFTWIVLVSGVVLGVLFSFVAVASNAYELDSLYTTDPDHVETREDWFQRKPFSWFNSLESQCQSTLLAVGGSYKTTNRGFVYTLSGIRNESGLIPAAAYKNAPLEECKVASITITLARMDNTRLGMNYWAWGASSAAATIACTTGKHEALQVNFTVALPAVGVRGTGSMDRLTDNFRYQNGSGSMNMWYGMQLTSAWYGRLPVAMAYSVPPDGASWGTGVVGLHRNDKVSDYTQSEFFLYGPSFSTDQGGLFWMHDNSTVADWKDGHAGLPNISISVDAFGKSFYSLLLSDFGVLDETNALANIAGIQYLQTRNDTDLVAAGVALNNTDYAHGPIDHVLDLNDPQDPAPNATDATSLFTQYLCSVPRRKGGMSLIIPVLIADIVFLQTCWKILTFVMTWWLGQKDPKMNHCEGCIARDKADALALDRVVSRPGHTRSYSGYQASEDQELLPVQHSVLSP